MEKLIMSRCKKTPVSNASGHANAFTEPTAIAPTARASEEYLRIARKNYTTKDGAYRLGEWCADQRTLYHLGLLDDWKTEELESVPGWTWDQAEIERKFAH